MKILFFISLLILIIGCKHKFSRIEIAQLKAETTVEKYLYSESHKKFEHLHFTRLRGVSKTSYEIGIQNFIPEKYKMVHRTVYFIVDTSCTKVEVGGITY